MSNVNHPAHYNRHPSGVECIDIVEAFNFNLGNAIKYIWRAGLKDAENPVEDLEKAEWYITRELDRLAARDGKVDPLVKRVLEGEQIKCGTFSKEEISADIRKRMDEDRERAEKELRIDEHLQRLDVKESAEKESAFVADLGIKRIPLNVKCPDCEVRVYPVKKNGNCPECGYEFTLKDLCAQHPNLDVKMEKESADVCIEEIPEIELKVLPNDLSDHKKAVGMSLADEAREKYEDRKVKESFSLSEQTRIAIEEEEDRKVKESFFQKVPIEELSTLTVVPKNQIRAMLKYSKQELRIFISDLDLSAIKNKQAKMKFFIAKKILSDRHLKRRVSVESYQRYGQRKAM